MKNILFFIGLVVALGVGVSTIIALDKENKELREMVNKNWEKIATDFNYRDRKELSALTAENNRLRDLHKNLNLDRCMCEVKHE